MHQIQARTVALGAGGIGLVLAVLVAFAFIALHAGGNVPLAHALGTPTPGGPDNISGVSCTDVWLDELQVPVATPFPGTLGDPPSLTTLDVALSLSRTTHDPAIPSPTPNITNATSVTYNGGIPGVIAGALPLSLVPQCTNVGAQLDTVAAGADPTGSPPVASVLTTNPNSVQVNQLVYWNSSTTVRKGFYKVTNVSGTSVTMTKTGAKCGSPPPDGSADGALFKCVATNNNSGGLPSAYGYENLDVTNNGLDGNAPRSTTGFYNPTTHILTYTTCSASDAVVENPATENAWTRTVITVKVSTASAMDPSVPSYGWAQLFNPTDPKTCADNANTLRSTNIITSWSVDSFAREGDMTKWTHDWDGDGCPDWQELAAPPARNGISPNFSGGRDPFNPYDCNHSSATAFQGIWGIDVAATPVTLDGGNNRIPGAFYRCRAAVLQTGTVFSVPIYCYTDAVLAGSPVVVNPAAAGGETLCPPGGAAPPAACGDGLGGSTYPSGSAGNPPHDWPAPDGPGCVMGSITVDHCPEQGAQCDNLIDDDGDGKINDGCPSKLYGQVDPMHNVITGSYNTATDLISFEGCYANVAGAQGPNIYVRTTNINPVTGHGTVAVWLAQATCAKPGGAATYPAANLQMVHLGQVGTTQGTGYDGDLDGCADYVLNADGSGTPGGELSQNRTLGGVRDPFNRWDFPDMPTGSNARKIRIDDVTYVINRYRHDRGQQPVPSPAYDPLADHLTIPGSNAWNLGSGNGQIRIDDVTAVINQYRNDCAP